MTALTTVNGSVSDPVVANNYASKVKLVKDASQGDNYYLVYFYDNVTDKGNWRAAESDMIAGDVITMTATAGTAATSGGYSAGWKYTNPDDGVYTFKAVGSNGGTDARATFEFCNASTDGGKLDAAVTALGGTATTASTTANPQSVTLANGINIGTVTSWTKTAVEAAIQAALETAINDSNVTVGVNVTNLVAQPTGTVGSQTNAADATITLSCGNAVDRVLTVTNLTVPYDFS
jgi:hypothetical protein